MKDYHINIFYSSEDGGYIADVPDLQACSAFGSTPEEALRQVQIAKTAWLKAMSSLHIQPKPTYLNPPCRCPTHRLLLRPAP